MADSSLSSSSLLARGLRHYAEVPPFEALGYHAQTTLWGDFGVADDFGKDAIKDTFKRTFNAFKDDETYGTELAMVLNHKAWQHHAQENEELTALYSELFDKVDVYILDHWKGEKLTYYLKTTD